MLRSPFLRVDTRSKRQILPRGWPTSVTTTSLDPGFFTGTVVEKEAAEVID
jgi:hypothetical protein